MAGTDKPPARKLLGQVLKEMGLLHEGQIQEALSVQRKKGGVIGKVMRDLGFVTESQVVQALGRQAGLEVVDVKGVEPSAECLARVPSATARLLRIVPVRLEKGRLTVAMADPMNAAALDDLRFTLGLEVTGAIADEKEVIEALDRIYGKEETTGRAALHDAVAEAAKELDAAGGGAAAFDLSDKEAMAKSAPVVKLLNFILLQAIRDRASDIHLEPFERDFKIRYRVDGSLFELESPPRHLAEALVSRVKVMSNLDIAETRVPQDGRIELSVSGRPVDIRVSTLPTIFGESCVMRVLDRSVVSLDLGRLGLRPDDLAAVTRFLDLPHGIVLVTGPTGSGKTTTLYSALNTVNDVALKIITTEDPVEYDIEGIVQVPINEEIGVTYSACLRSILRQDPDVILVGEIRDADTARIAIEASLTGHLVFSTLHTNDAPSAITRLVDIGVEPFLLAATIEAIIAQRLVRRVCSSCRFEYTPDESILRELSLREEEVRGKKFARGKGCEKCHGSGYSGRIALYEILVASDRLKQMILDAKSVDAIRLAAREEGMRTLRESGLLAIGDGETTVEEVLRET